MKLKEIYGRGVKLGRTSLHYTKKAILETKRGVIGFRKGADQFAREWDAISDEATKEFKPKGKKRR